MKSKNLVRTTVILLILALNISCDQVSKSIARHNLVYNEQVNVVKTYLVLIKVENTGAFLSMGNSYPKPIKLLVMIILPIVALGYGMVYMLTNKKLTTLTTLAICFMIGGGIGNIYDRTVYGSVTDFLHMDFGFFRTGIFNLADVSLMCGIFLFLVEYYIQYKATKQQSTTQVE